MSIDFSTLLEVFNSWLLGEGWKIVAIIVGVFVVQRFIGLFVSRAIRQMVIRDRNMTAEDERKREDTLIRIVNSTLMVLLWLAAGMMILSSLGIEVGPLIAAAGIVGLAFGFGGQYLIRDVISGLFMILENQFRVGDVVSLDGTGGTVEDITLRMTTLRDIDGVVHHIPNGTIAHVANKGKDFSRVHLQIGIGYDADLELVERVVNRVGEELAMDAEFADDITSAPKFQRVDEFGDSAIIIKILGDVKPLKQWGVAGELRKRLKIAFDKEGIDIPFPQRVIKNIP